MQRIFETKNIYRGIIVALLIVVFFFSWREFEGRQKYYAVYTSSGDMYFGKLTFFPSLVIKDAYVLQQDGEGGFFLSPFTSALWGPDGDIKLNRDNVIWMADIDKESQTAKLLSGAVIPQASSNTPQVESGIPQGMLPETGEPVPTSTEEDLLGEDTPAEE